MSPFAVSVFDLELLGLQGFGWSDCSVSGGCNLSLRLCEFSRAVTNTKQLSTSCLNPILCRFLHICSDFHQAIPIRYLDVA